jgi:peroxiredoxin-like protein
MQPFPHRYVVMAEPAGDGDIRLATHDAPTLSTAAPPEFDGPGGRWSPETLLVGAAADCFAITFAGVARASGLPWTDMTCAATGTLERDGVTRFTRIDFDVRLVVPEGYDAARIKRVLDKVERTCLITNSLNAVVDVHATVNARSLEADVCPA